MKTYTGKNIDTLLASISSSQGVNINEIEYKVINEIGFSIFKKYEIEAYSYVDCIETLVKYIRDVLETSGFKDVVVEVEHVNYNNSYIVNVSSHNNGLLIGMNGKNLYALESLSLQVLSNKYRKRFNVRVDSNNYFKDKEIKLRRLAQKVAAEVGKTKIDVVLDPMPNYDRKVIHKALKDLHYVKTKSRGIGKDRHLVIMYDRENDIKYNNEKRDKKH